MNAKTVNTNKVKTDINDGIGLNDEEISELYHMYISGKYYIKEIIDWFGISPTKLKTYLKIYLKKHGGSGNEIHTTITRRKMACYRKNRKATKKYNLSIEEYL